MKRRADSAFGLHFDFHAHPSQGKVIGETLKEEDIREICQSLRPDFIQIDCKGHPGYASYPTKCGNAMPEFKGDPLALWRRVTKEEGVALYMHYSGVWDGKYSEEHPEDTVIRSDGTLVQGITRPLGRYDDDLLIPQLKELAGVYGVDGVWVDGECWAARADYRPETVALFEKETGINLKGLIPAKRDDPYFFEYNDFCRELFRRHLRYYVDAVHAEYPDFQIASNWAFSDHMPEAVSANVDFLSGDFNPWNSFNVARYAGRALAGQNHPWDLMAWNFRAQAEGKPGGLPKHPVQIMQEASTVLAVGGGFQNYITQYTDGSPRMDQIRRMKEVAEFVRAREPFCFRGRAVHEAVILLSTFDRYREINNLFSRGGYERIVGLTALFCDAGQPVEIASEHTLHGRCADYKLIVIPELAVGLEPSMIDELLAYAENGGSLLLTGKNTCRIFEQAGLPFTVDSDNRDGQWRWVSVDRKEAGMLCDAHTVTADTAETVVWYDQADPAGGVILPYGRGRIGVLAADIGSQYGDCAQFIHRKAIRALCEKLYTPAVTVEKALGLLEITELCKNGRTYIQLVNANGQHAGNFTATEDFIPPVVDVTLSVALDAPPKALILQPCGRELPFEYSDGRAYVFIDRVDIHNVLEIVE
ncbi:MAG: hypothetical protein IKM04_00160 [Clostridia bacterium]|nr:hypothetical protein [Clostridia bacterium]